MAAVLTAGLSTEKGDLPATAASNVNGPATQEAGLSKWRKAKMKIQGFLAGLGVLGKVALGVGVAAAATTGAGAAGILPFSVPGVGTPHHHLVVAHATTTTTVKPALKSGGPKRGKHHAKPGTHVVGIHHTVVTTSTTTDTKPVTVKDPPVVTTTTVTTPTSETPTTVDSPITEPPTTEDPPATTTTTIEPTTTTTVGGSAPTQSIQLSCTATGATQVTCTWTAAPGFNGTYALWRWTTGGNGSDYAPIFQSHDGLTYVDNNVTPGVPYTYRVFTTQGDGTTSGPWSNKFYMSPL